MSDRTPEHRHAVADWLHRRIEWKFTGNTWMAATVLENRGEHLLIELDDPRFDRLVAETKHTRPLDPSSPETRQTPSPVQEPSDGENASGRDSQGVETASLDGTPGLDFRGNCSNCHEPGHDASGCLRAHDIAAAWSWKVVPDPPDPMEAAIFASFAADNAAARAASERPEPSNLTDPRRDPVGTLRVTRGGVTVVKTYLGADWANGAREALRRVRAIVERTTAEPAANEEGGTVDVFGYSGEFLYAGHLQPRQGGGWNVFHHTDPRHERTTTEAVREPSRPLRQHSFDEKCVHCSTDDDVIHGVLPDGTLLVQAPPEFCPHFGYDGEPEDKEAGCG